MADDIANVTIPVLGPDGWVGSTLKGADQLMGWFLATNYSTTLFHRGRLKSFQWIVAQNEGKPFNMIADTKAALEEMFNDHFDDVEVSVYDLSKSSEPSKFDMGIQVTFRTKDGTIRDLTEVVQVKGSVFERMNELSGANQ